MTFEYVCPKCYAEFEVFYKSMSAAEPFEKSAPCDCGATAIRKPSMPLGFGLYGDPAGYDKPSATKRHSTKLVSAIDGNKNAIG